MAVRRVSQTFNQLHSSSWQLNSVTLRQEIVSKHGQKEIHQRENNHMYILHTSTVMSSRPWLYHQMSTFSDFTLPTHCFMLYLQFRAAPSQTHFSSATVATVASAHYPSTHWLRLDLSK